MGTFQQWSPEEADRAKRMAELLQPNRESARIEAFSDGVFAIAITVLVLEIKVPTIHTDQDLLQDLLKLAPNYAGYAISFLTILVMWMNHHRLFKLVRRTDEWLPFANGILLLVVSFVPFPTAVMAAYWKTPNQQMGVLFYSGTFILLALTYNLVWFCISHKDRLVDRKLDHQKIEAVSRQFVVGPLMYIAAFAVGFWSPLASLVMNMIYAIFFAIPGLSFAKVDPESEEVPAV